MNKQELATKIWESANKLRSNLDANDYKDLILGFIFYKYLSEREQKFLIKEQAYEYLIGKNEEDETYKEILELCKSTLGYFIDPKQFFSVWVESDDFSIANVNDVLNAFDRHIGDKYDGVFSNIFTSLQMVLSKMNGDTGIQTKYIKRVLEIIKDIPSDNKSGYDVLGYIYEYLISNFAADAGKKAGEFYTPHEVSMLMSEIVAEELKEKTKIKIYDPTSGSGSLLINIGEVIKKYNKRNEKDNIVYYAQEIKESTYNLTRMNLLMRDIIVDNIKTRNADTLVSDWPIEGEDGSGPLYVDAVVSNPPYSQHWDPRDKEYDPRYSRFGLAPATKADYAFLLHDLYHLKDDGVMCIVLPHGVLFRGNAEGEIRKNLIEFDHIDTIIGLPANIFYGTGIPTIIMVIKKKRVNNNILFIDASQNFTKEGKNNKLRACDIKRIKDAYINREDIPGYSKVVSKEEIRANEYNLNIPRYVDNYDSGEQWDLYSSIYGGIPLKEIKPLEQYWKSFPSLKEDLIKPINDEYIDIVDLDLKDVISKNKDIELYKNNIKNIIEEIGQYVDNKIIQGYQSINVAAVEEEIAKFIFEKIKPYEILDKYDAYQILDDHWIRISGDLEIICNDGWDMVREVVPLMVTKKQKGVDVEVQDGYEGRIIPFSIVRKTILLEDDIALRNSIEKESDMARELEEMIEELSVDDRESIPDAFDDNNKIISRKIYPTIKELKQIEDEDSKRIVAVLEKYRKGLNDLANLKRKNIEDEAELLMKCKTTIEKLDDSQARYLLNVKWIQPFMEDLTKLDTTLITDLSNKLINLKDKYSETLTDIDMEIKSISSELAGMFDELEGSKYDMEALQEFKKLLVGDYHD